jgi:hypothetical protein
MSKNQIWLQNSIKSENLRYCIMAIVQPRNNDSAMKLLHSFNDHNAERKLDFSMNCGPVRGKVVLHMSFQHICFLQGINKISKTATEANTAN